MSALVESEPFTFNDPPVVVTPPAGLICPEITRLFDASYAAHEGHAIPIEVPRPEPHVREDVSVRGALEETVETDASGAKLHELSVVTSGLI